MDSVFNSLINIFSKDYKPKERPPLNYLDVKNGKLNFKIGYPATLNKSSPLPSLVLDTNAFHE